MVTTASETAPHMMVGPVLLCVYKDEALSGGYHGSGPPQTGPEPLRDGSRPPTCGSRTSSRPEPSSQPRGPDPAPYSGRGRSRQELLWARPLTPGSGAATCPTGANLWTPLPTQVGLQSRHEPLWGASAEPRVQCRHVSHRRESFAVSQPACRIKRGWLRRALSAHLPH